MLILLAVGLLITVMPWQVTGITGEGQETAQEIKYPYTFGPIVTSLAIPLAKGKFSLQPYWYLYCTNSKFSPNWRRIGADGNYASFETVLQLNYGLWDDLQVYALVPFIQNWANGVNNPGPNGERSADFGGLGDVSLSFKYRVIAETSVVPTVSYLLTVGFPNGHFNHLNPGRLGTDRIGNGSYAFTTGVNLSKLIPPLIVYANLWYTLHTDFTTDAATTASRGAGASVSATNHPPDRVTINLAMEWPFFGKWVALVELFGYGDAGRLIGPQANQTPSDRITILPAMEYLATTQLSFALGLEIDLAGKNANANYTPVLSLIYLF
ncbi:MAG: transporter [Desulfobaccales bacterium]